MRILSVSSQVAFGPVGNTAAVPALQAKGHEVMAVPTIMLSNHPGHGKPAGFRTAPEDLGRILDALAALGALDDCDAVLTGYFAAPEQIDVVEAALARMKVKRPDLFVLVDPVMGDGAALYVPEAVAQALRGKLVPLATCLTPNRFELEWLSGLPVTGAQSAMDAAQSLARPEVLATSIPAGDEELATLLITPDATQRHVARKLAHVPHGTGDFLSGLYLAARLECRPGEAFHDAMRSLDCAIALSAGTSVLDVAGALRLVQRQGHDNPSVLD
jgi:pyridoxine kinase